VSVSASDAAPPVPEVAPPAGREPAHPALVVGVLVGLLVVAAVGVTLGGELGDFMVAALGSAPLALLGFFAHLGTRRRWARVVTFVWMIGLLFGSAFIVLLLGIAAVDPSIGAMLGGRRSGASASSAARIAGLTGWIGLSLLIGLTGLVRAERAPVARLLPLDPDAFVHKIAWTTVLTLILLGLAPLIALGEPILLTLTAREIARGSDPTSGRGTAGSLRDALYGLIWLIPGALVAVGYPTVRGAREALLRLGLVAPTRRQVTYALGLAVVFALLFTGIDAAIGALWESQGWPRTDQATVSHLMRFAFSPLGAVVVGITAGLGEELAVRGALQPRLGLLMSNLLFTSLHGFQYHWDALLSVFLAGMLLGLIRARSNTTTSAIVHGSYDFLLLLAGWLDL
jgi:hypothetical protein